MNKLIISIYISLSLIVFLQDCDYGLSGQKESSTKTLTTFILQGSIVDGKIVINQEEIFAKDNKNGFVIEQIVKFLDSYKKEDIYIGKVSNRFRGAKSSNYYFPKLHKILISKDFQGTMYIFTSFSSYHDAGSYTKRGNFWRDSIYGTALADALKNTHSITHMSKNKDYPVGAQKPIVVNGGANPDSVRALMQAAKDAKVKDPRLLVIKRGAGDTQVTITAFGKEEKIDAGKTYEWKFGEEHIKELRKFVVKR